MREPPSADSSSPRIAAELRAVAAGLPAEDAAWLAAAADRLMRDYRPARRVLSRGDSYSVVVTRDCGGYGVPETGFVDGYAGLLGYLGSLVDSGRLDSCARSVEILREDVTEALPEADMTA